MNNTRNTYTPQRVPFLDSAAWRHMIADMISSRELILRLAQRDISVRYRQSLLGYVWAVAPQLVTVGIFASLARYRVFDMGESTLPYLVHALWSISVWQLFSVSLVSCTNSLVNAGSLVTKVNFPKESLVVASIASALVDFVIRLVPVFVVMLWMGFVPSLKIFLLPVILVLILLFAVGIGFIFSIVNLVVRDMGNMVSMIMTFGVFLAPILYPPPVTEPFSLINVANPFSPLLIATQDVLSGGALSYPRAFMFSSFISIVVFLVGWRVFRITLPRVTERA